MADKYVSPPIPLKLGPESRFFKRADIELEGVEHEGPSYEGRVFVNNPDADENTPMTPEHGYAGSFHVYGSGLWPEGEGELASAEGAFDPGKKVVIATDAIRQAAQQGSEVTITVIPVESAVLEESRGDGKVLKLAKVNVVTHNK